MSICGKGNDGPASQDGFFGKKTQNRPLQVSLRIREKRFQKKARRTIKRYAKRGYAPFCLDESTYVIAPNTRRGWYLRGKEITTPVNYTRAKFCSFGALGADLFHYRFYERANSYSFIDFLKSLRKKHGKILLFADNVAYHKSGKVKRYLKSTKRNVVVIHFPRYTPELNPVEVQWRQIKKNLGNRFFADTNEMKNCIRRLIRTGVVPVVKLFNYLTL